MTSVASAPPRPPGFFAFVYSELQGCECLFRSESRFGDPSGSDSARDARWAGRRACGQLRQARATASRYITRHSTCTPTSRGSGGQGRRSTVRAVGVAWPALVSRSRDPQSVARAPRASPYSASSKARQPSGDSNAQSSHSGCSLRVCASFCVL